MNITKSGEAVLHEIGWEHHALAEILRDAVWIMGLDGRFTYVSPSITAQTGFLPEEYVEQSIEEFLTPESAAHIVGIIQSQLALPPEQRIESILVEVQQKTKAGSIIDAEANASWIYDDAGNPVGIIGVTRDISERKRAEQQLRESEERFRAFSSFTTEGIVVHENGMIIDANQAAASMAGYPNPEAMIGRHGLNDMPFTPESRQALAPHLNSPTLEIQDAEFLRPDGTSIRVLVRGRQTLLRGCPVRIVSFLDITDRKRAEEERALNARRLSALLEINQMSSASIHDLTHFAMEEAVSLTGSSIGYIAFVNEDETVLTMFAWSKAAMVECAIGNKPITYPVNSTGLWGEAIRQRRPIITNDYAAANPWIKGVPEGHCRIVRHMNVPIFDGNRIVIVAGVGNKIEDYDEGDVRQLTLLMEGIWRIVNQRRAEEERKNLQDQLAQASKMEAVGRLAGGVAHDFNNLLTTILGYSELILTQIPDADPFRTEVQEISKAGKRAASLTQQLLAFSRKQVIKPRAIDLNDEVGEARKMLERLIGENIKLVLDLAPHLDCIKVDPHQIDQVLLNLAVNSRDAMPDGGTLTIATANVTIGKDRAPCQSDMAPGDYVVLSVADTGIGMNEETRMRIFEPFFSTKEVGKGTGLGLAMVYGIAKQNGGAVTVDSSPGQGTAFKIYLPRTGDMPAGIGAAARIASPSGNETVLLVEDDEMVQRLTRKMLIHFGYEVLQARDIEDAIQICEAHPAPIRLLLTDVIMPGMNGVELYARVRLKRPQMKALFMSGYAEDVVVRQGVLSEDTQFIQKPFSTDTLASKVREALDS
jgi:PAS domain S-box-containing protein